ncbi:MAG: hypothetical protein P8124_01680 [Gammaproteobacteria bacterium]
MKRAGNLLYATAGLLMLIAGTAMAGSSAGRLTVLGVNDDGIVQFTAGTHINTPRCVKRGGTWAIALSRPGAQAMLELLRTAAASGAVVRVEGSGLCDDVARHERPREVRLEYPRP